MTLACVMCAENYLVHCWTVVVHAFNSSICEAEQMDLCEFKASLVYES